LLLPEALEASEASLPVWPVPSEASQPALALALELALAASVLEWAA
jgi:hypothetical protein